MAPIGGGQIGINVSVSVRDDDDNVRGNKMSEWKITFCAHPGVKSVILLLL
jgi:hypothetical protein